MNAVSQSHTLAIIDYGMGNLHSAKKAFEHVCDHQIIVTQDHDAILSADRVVLPGVGAMRDCMAAMLDLNIDQIIKEVVDQGKPLLGICIGMQAMLSRTDENDGVDCLNLFEGHVSNFSRFDSVQQAHLKVPHMGWNQVRQHEHPLWHGIDNQSYFYFVHSFCVDVNPLFSIGECTYGETFSAAIARDNIFAVQFHPEKSGDNGLQLLKNFSQWQL